MRLRRRSFRIFLAFSATCGLAASPSWAPAQIYKHVDAEGRVTYSNAPVEPGYELADGSGTPQGKKSAEDGSALMTAAQRGDIAAMSDLLRAGASPNFASAPHKQAPLHKAVTAMENAAPVTKRLLDAGAAVNAYDEAGRTPLDSANPAHPEIAETLKKRGGHLAAGQKASTSDSDGSLAASSAGSPTSGATSRGGASVHGGGMDEETTRYGYDAGGRLERVERNGAVTTYQYDDRNNLVRRSRGGAVRDYTVNEKNQVIRMRDR